MTKTKNTPIRNRKVAANSNIAESWWTSDKEWSKESCQQELDSRTLRACPVPGGGGNMMLFNRNIYVKLLGVTNISALDDNKRVCFSLGEEEYNFLSEIESLMVEKYLRKKIDEEYKNAELKVAFPVSEKSEKPYAKTKIVTNSWCRTRATNDKGVPVNEVGSLLRTTGNEFDVVLRIEGTYLTRTHAGLLVKVDMMRCKKVASEADNEERKRKFEEESEDEANKRFKAFLNGGVE